MTVPVTAFAHQYEFYKSHRLPIMFFGHPLASQYAMRPPRPAPPPDGGTIALLPGSRAGELQYHVPALLAALRILRVDAPEAARGLRRGRRTRERTIARAIKRARA